MVKKDQPFGLLSSCMNINLLLLFNTTIEDTNTFIYVTKAFILLSNNTSAIKNPICYFDFYI